MWWPRCSPRAPTPSCTSPRIWRPSGGDQEHRGRLEQGGRHPIDDGADRARTRAAQGPTPLRRRALLRQRLEADPAHAGLSLEDLRQPLSAEADRQADVEAHRHPPPVEALLVVRLGDDAPEAPGAGGPRCWHDARRMLWGESAASGRGGPIHREQSDGARVGPAGRGRGPRPGRLLANGPRGAESASGDVGCVPSHSKKNTAVGRRQESEITEQRPLGLLLARV